MSEFNEAEFQDFLSAGGERENVQELFESIILRGRLFLSERGVKFASIDSAAAEEIDDERQMDDELDKLAIAKEAELGREVTAEELIEGYRQSRLKLIAEQRLLAANDIHLMHLVITLAKLTVLQAEGHEVPIETCTTIKKRFQALYKIEGLPPAWQELVDAELPGEPLGEGDESLVDEMAVHYFKSSVEAEEKLTKVRSNIQAVLAEEGSEVTTLEEQIAVILLANAHALNPHGNTSWQEEAQLILMNQGVPINAAWTKVITLLQP